MLGQHLLAVLQLLASLPGPRHDGLLAITQSNAAIVHHEDGTCTIPQTLCSAVEEQGNNLMQKPELRETTPLQQQPLAVT